MIEFFVYPPLSSSLQSYTDYQCRCFLFKEGKTCANLLDTEAGWVAFYIHLTHSVCRKLLDEEKINF